MGAGSVGTHQKRNFLRPQMVSCALNRIKLMILPSSLSLQISQRVTLTFDGCRATKNSLQGSFIRRWGEKESRCFSSIHLDLTLHIQHARPLRPSLCTPCGKFEPICAKSVFALFRSVSGLSAERLKRSPSSTSRRSPSTSQGTGKLSLLPILRSRLYSAHRSGQDKLLVDGELAKSQPLS